MAGQNARGGYGVSQPDAWAALDHPRTPHTGHLAAPAPTGCIVSAGLGRAAAMPTATRLQRVRSARPNSGGSRPPPPTSGCTTVCSHLHGGLTRWLCRDGATTGLGPAGQSARCRIFNLGSITQTMTRLDIMTGMPMRSTSRHTAVSYPYRSSSLPKRTTPGAACRSTQLRAGQGRAGRAGSVCGGGMTHTHGS